MPVRSIRARITLLTVCSIVVTTVLISLISVVAVKSLGDSSSDQMLQLLCETGQKSLDSYLESVEQSVDAVSDYASADFAVHGDKDLTGHLERVSEVFEKTAVTTHGVLTYYYRIDPAFNPDEAGFWFVDMGRGEFAAHEVTDITEYNVEDTSSLVWFTVPRATGQAVWQPPYITENLGALVISYNEPIYWDGVFVGVVGMEIDVDTLVDQVDDIVVLETGYAFVADEDKIIYHPAYGSFRYLEQDTAALPAELRTTESFVNYRYDGVKRRATWMPLSNGMRLYVTVPREEIDAGWHRMALMICVVSAVLLGAFVFVALRFAEQITKPLVELTEVALKVDQGDYDVELSYDGKDEVGILTRTFRQLIAHIKEHITNLNDLAYADALTSVRNKGAFDIYQANMQKRLDDDGRLSFAICVFDCNNLKQINDQYGHDKGDIYLKTSCRLICDVFDHSPVFRTGGDEFVAILENVDYRDRDELIARFDMLSHEISEAASNPWDAVNTARGIAVYDPESDSFVEDVTRRADKAMYEDKRRPKGLS